MQLACFFFLWPTLHTCDENPRSVMLTAAYSCNHPYAESLLQL